MLHKQLITAAPTPKNTWEMCELSCREQANCLAANHRPTGSHPLNRHPLNPHPPSLRNHMGYKMREFICDSCLGFTLQFSSLNCGKIGLKSTEKGNVKYECVNIIFKLIAIE